MTDASSVPPSGSPSEPSAPIPASGLNLRAVTILCYVLFLLACVNGVTALIGVIVAYLKRADAAGTVWASHFENMIVMFWVSLLVAIIGWTTIWFLIGFVVFGVLLVWYLYRAVRGLLRAADDKPY